MRLNRKVLLAAVAIAAIVPPVTVTNAARLVRFGPAGAEKPGLLDDAGVLHDASGVIDDITPRTLAGGAVARLAGLDPQSLPAVAGKPRLGPPVAGVGKIVALALNYRAHAAESSSGPAPAEPVLFMKATSAISGPTDPIIRPQGAKKIDWEVELGVVIGRRALNVRRDAALDYVAGYLICGDVSERAFQREHGGQHMKGKSADSFAPLGPWLLSADRVADPQALRLWTEVNGRRMQDASTADMISGVAATVSYISRFMTLNAGDVICTGTPSGVGVARKPPVFLKDGDTLVHHIDGLGIQRHVVISPGREKGDE